LKSEHLLNYTLVYAGIKGYSTRKALCF
jgi:hypothetical protein